MAAPLLTSADRARARALLAEQGLAFEEPLDDLVGIFDGGALVATGARAGPVLKMLAIAPSHQGGGALGELVTALVARAAEAGERGALVFTRPAAAASFEQLGFRLLAASGRAALLELGDGFVRWLGSHAGAVREGDNGAVVVNCNPFTRGHRHLLEHAAARCATLYAFVVREDRSAFPFEVRLALVREGTRDLPNVRVLDTGRYAVSAATFPAYFLRAADEAAAAQMELDAILFARRIAPAFRVRRRFVGTEPLCPTTRAYNEALARVLPREGVELVEVPRLEAGSAPISASRVREALRAGTLDGLEALVPETTRAFLASAEAAPVRARLLASGGRHG